MRSPHLKHSYTIEFKSFSQLWQTVYTVFTVNPASQTCIPMVRSVLRDAFNGRDWIREAQTVLHEKKVHSLNINTNISLPAVALLGVRTRQSENDVPHITYRQTSERDAMVISGVSPHSPSALVLDQLFLGVSFISPISNAARNRLCAVVVSRDHER